MKKKPFDNELTRKYANFNEYLLFHLSVNLGVKFFFVFAFKFCLMNTNDIFFLQVFDSFFIFNYAKFMNNKITKNSVLSSFDM